MISSPSASDRVLETCARVIDAPPAEWSCALLNLTGLTRLRVGLHGTSRRSGSLAHLALPNGSISCVRLHQRTTTDSFNGPLPTLVMLRLGTADLSMPGRSPLPGQSDIFLLEPGQRLVSLVPQEAEGLLIRFQAIPESAPLRLADYAVESIRTEVDQFIADTRYVIDHAVLVRRAILLLERLRALLSGRRLPSLPSPANNADLRVEQVLGFIQAEPDWTFCMDFLAARVHTGPRNLHRLIRRQTGITPYACYQRARLLRVREDIARLVDPEATVSWYATGHGFTHLSRFSGDYRRLFGELPSVTLAQRKALTDPHQAPLLDGRINLKLSATDDRALN